MDSLLTRMLSGRHRATEESPSRREVVASILLRSLGIAVVGGILIFCNLGWDWAHSRDRQAEHTVVVSVTDASGERHCDKYRWGQNMLVTRRSTDPPLGLPAVFTHVEACDVPEVGDEEIVVRVPHGALGPKIYIEPARSFDEVVGLTLLATGLVLVVAVALFTAAELWRWARRRLTVT